jgi:DNA-binding transcriptional MocR family regulator
LEWGVTLEIQLDVKSGVPFYRQIIDQVKAAIATETIAAGDRLPTVRQLAVDLSINPNTVSRAYTELELTGLVGRGHLSATGPLSVTTLSNGVCSTSSARSSFRGFRPTVSPSTTSFKTSNSAGSAEKRSSR